MRGVRTEAVQANADTTIGFFIDGIYRSRPSQALASFVDLERVEVQRGPQGKLFGRNTFGGNIVLSTARPELNDFSDFQKGTYTAAYAQLSFAATDDLKFTGGLRYTVDKKKYKFANRNSVVPISANLADPDPVSTSQENLVAGDAAFGSAGVTNCGPAVTGFPAGLVALGANCGGVGNYTFFGATYTPVQFKKSTGRLAAEYSLSKSQLLYVSYSTGFSSGGFNGSQAAMNIEATCTFSPQEVIAVEIGSKNRFLNNTLQFNVAAFMNHHTNQQEQRQVPMGLNTALLLFKAAKAKANGVELEGEWRVTRDA